MLGKNKMANIFVDIERVKQDLTGLHGKGLTAFDRNPLNTMPSPMDSVAKPSKEVEALKQSFDLGEGTNYTQMNQPGHDEIDVGLDVLTFGISGVASVTKNAVDFHTMLKADNQPIIYDRPQPRPEEQKPTHTHPVYIAKKSGLRPNGF
jgi:hypothetical protein